MKITGTKDLASYRSNAIDKVNNDAETCRNTFITSGAGMAMIYNAKQVSANAFLVKFPTQEEAKYATEGMWPFIFAEVGITAPTLWEVAEVISQQASRWNQTASDIEKLRLAAQDAINAAPCEAAIDELTNIKWPT